MEYESIALPVELQRHIKFMRYIIGFPDLSLMNNMVSLISHTKNLDPSLTTFQPTLYGFTVGKHYPLVGRVGLEPTELEST